MPVAKETVNILGTRGIPAKHGGFETFAENLALYLVNKGWTVNVYCQDDTGTSRDGTVTQWKGVNLIHFGTTRQGPVGTMDFDLKCARHVLTLDGVDLVLGYNTAIFNVLQRLRGRRVIMNMDGIEWKRQKWSLPAKIWFFINEVIGANLCHVAVADHPGIAAHVRRRCFKKPVIIPYGAPLVTTADAPPLGLTPDRYFVSIARIEPENSILELVQAAASLPPDFPVVILGKLDDANPYHQRVKAAAGANVMFPGAIYDSAQVASLRLHARAYLHGHQVGGTNPSLVEALGAGNAVLAHDNKFNRWTTDNAQFYFSSADSCASLMKQLVTDDAAVHAARAAARAQHAAKFIWEDVLSAYTEVLLENPKKTAVSPTIAKWAEV
ncbi:MAG: DUF1972 domain-containing protein [Rhodobacteraceae bacterium]|nr:DUF1972 domain-containing protein [Paracoccaceae bacterium]